MNWRKSFRADPRALPLADRHYNRQSIGSPQFVPPGGCLVLLTPRADALWVTSTPMAEYTKHAWAGAWVNSLFRNESGLRASDLIREAVAASLSELGSPPDLGIVSFVDPDEVRHSREPGRCYRLAGWHHVGFTKSGLWAYQILPHEMPEPAYLENSQIPLAL